MLRQYQKDACNAVVSWFNYHDTPAIVVVATGGGKSHIIASLADYYAKSARVLIIAHRKELLQQTGEKITSNVGFYSASLGEKD
ncbi:MAG: DEAD/DEAH box helicase, partial [Pseudomonadota bacterium]